MGLAGIVTMVLAPLVPVAHRLLGQLEVLFQRELGRDPLPLQYTVVGVHGFLGGNLVLRNQPEKLDESQLVLGVVDLATEQCQTRAVLFGIGSRRNAS
ncbi:MAG: hypothetical protein CM1200mP29_17670 [Verrucomicrobiota bacterium]|nr:MAG: hypothetical protein CM1200mP29_17670 [Verrucomicrobiota bacterium]